MSEPTPLTGSPSVHPALAQYTGFLLSRLGFLSRRRFGELLETLGVTPRMWAAVSVLDHDGPLAQRELGRLIGMDPSSMVATIDELESRGLVERRRHPSDRRTRVVHLTDRGRETLGRGRKLIVQAEDELLASLDPEERRQLHDLLLRVSHGRLE